MEKVKVYMYKWNTMTDTIDKSSHYAQKVYVESENIYLYMYDYESDESKSSGGFPLWGDGISVLTQNELDRVIEDRWEEWYLSDEDLEINEVDLIFQDHNLGKPDQSVEADAAVWKKTIYSALMPGRSDEPDRSLEIDADEWRKAVLNAMV